MVRLSDASKLLRMDITDNISVYTGGILGFYCAHKYAHTRKGMNKLMPFALKGIDVAVFSVFRSLGLKVGVRPILNTSNLEWMDGTASSSEESSDISKIGDAFHELQLGSVGGYDDCEDEVRQVSQILNK
jgi:hypothetical protein